MKTTQKNKHFRKLLKKRKRNARANRLSKVTKVTIENVEVKIKHPESFRPTGREHATTERVRAVAAELRSQSSYSRVNDVENSAKSFLYEPTGPSTSVAMLKNISQSKVNIMVEPLKNDYNQNNSFFVPLKKKPFDETDLPLNYSMKTYEREAENMHNADVLLEVKAEIFKTNEIGASNTTKDKFIDKAHYSIIVKNEPLSADEQMHNVEHMALELPTTNEVVAWSYNADNQLTENISIEHAHTLMQIKSEPLDFDEQMHNSEHTIQINTEPVTSDEVSNENMEQSYCTIEIKNEPLSSDEQMHNIEHSGNIAQELPRPNEVVSTVYNENNHLPEISYIEHAHSPMQIKSEPLDYDEQTYNAEHLQINQEVFNPVEVVESVYNEDIEQAQGLMHIKNEPLSLDVDEEKLYNAELLMQFTKEASRSMELSTSINNENVKLQEYIERPQCSKQITNKSLTSSQRGLRLYEINILFAEDKCLNNMQKKDNIQTNSNDTTILNKIQPVKDVQSKIVNLKSKNTMKKDLKEQHDINNKNYKFALHIKSEILSSDEDDVSANTETSKAQNTSSLTYQISGANENETLKRNHAKENLSVKLKKEKTGHSMSEENVGFSKKPRYDIEPHIAKVDLNDHIPKTSKSNTSMSSISQEDVNIIEDEYELQHDAAEIDVQQVEQSEEALQQPQQENEEISENVIESQQNEIMDEEIQENQQDEEQNNEIITENDIENYEEEYPSNRMRVQFESNVPSNEILLRQLESVQSHNGQQSSVGRNYQTVPTYIPIPQIFPTAPRFDYFTQTISSQFLLPFESYLFRSSNSGTTVPQSITTEIVHASASRYSTNAAQHDFEPVNAPIFISHIESNWNHMNENISPFLMDNILPTGHQHLRMSTIEHDFESNLPLPMTVGHHHYQQQQLNNNNYSNALNTIFEHDIQHRHVTSSSSYSNLHDIHSHDIPTFVPLTTLPMHLSAYIPVMGPPMSNDFFNSFDHPLVLSDDFPNFTQRRSTATRHCAEQQENDTSDSEMSSWDSDFSF